MNKTDCKKTICKNIEQIYKKGNIQQAIELCQYEIAKDPVNPSNVDLHIKLGDLYLEWHLDIYQAKQYIDEAITEYQKALELFDESEEIDKNIDNNQKKSNEKALNKKAANLYYKIGCAFFCKNEIDKAINYFNLAVSKHEKYSAAYYMLAESYTAKYDLQAAFDYVQKAIYSNPLSSSRAHFLYNSLLNLSTRKSPKKFFLCLRELILGILTVPFEKKMVKKVLKMFSYVKFLPSLTLAAYYLQKNQINNAIDIYQSILEKAPRFVFLYCLLGEVYRSLGRFDDALCEYKMAAWLDNLNVPAYRAMCLTYEEQGDYDSAIETYKKLIKIQPYIPEYYSNLASLFYLKEDVKDAISCYQNAVTLNPNAQWTSIIAQTLGYIYQSSQEDINAAIASYQTAYLLNPNDIDIYIHLGSAFYEKGEYENALMVYKKALELDPHNAKIHCNLGYLYWGIGLLEEAIKSYELAIKYDKEYDIAYNNLGVIYLDDLGRVQMAIDLFDNAIKCNQNYTLAYYNLARAITVTGDKTMAAKLYQAAYDLNQISHELDSQEVLDRIKNLFE